MREAEAQCWGELCVPGQVGSSGDPSPPQAHLGELALLIDEGDDVHGLVGDHVQGILVVGELNVQPVDGLQVVLLLLQLEHVPHEELLQVLVGEVDAELLEAVGSTPPPGVEQGQLSPFCSWQEPPGPQPFADSNAHKCPWMRIFIRMEPLCVR